MSLRFLFVALTLTAIVVLIACAPAPTPAPASAPSSSAAYAAPTAAPAPTRAVAASSSSAASSAPASSAAAAGSLSSAPSGANALTLNTSRKIIKNAQMQLTVESADVGIDRLTGITIDMGGYIVSTRIFTENGLKAATVSFAVPVDQFEATLRRVRAIALKVDQESSSGQDVSDQYVDLESQLKNLQATANRIREFLSKAQTVDEALKVNQQLSDVEKQIETIKGKMNYIDDRSAFSTITVDLREPRPTPTPTFTPTATATPTPTATPMPTATPVGWHPDETFGKAVSAQATLVKGLVDLIIWFVVVLLPYLIGLAVLLWLLMRFQVWMNKRIKSRSQIKPPDST